MLPDVSSIIIMSALPSHPEIRGFIYIGIGIENQRSVVEATYSGRT